MTETPWRAGIHAILPHPERPRALLLQGTDGWALPHATPEHGVWQASLGTVNEAMGALLDLPVTTLRYVEYEPDWERRHVEAVFVLEPPPPRWEPPAGGTWAGEEELDALPLAHPEHRPLISGVLAELRTGRVPELRQPWARPGWFEQAAGWTRSELERLGDTLTGPLEQVKCWAIACILRAPTTRGVIYFKVASSRPLFVHEPLLTRGLASLYPEHIPVPLAIDEARRWMLLEDLGPALDWDAPVEVLEEVLLLYGRIQRDAAGRIDALLRMGCVDRRLEHLAAQIDPLLMDDALLASLMEPSAIERLRALAPRLKASCAELARYAIPQTLVHGDLHPGNVARPGGRYVFFDWTDACISHPFFDAIAAFRSDAAAAEARLRDGYLHLWAGYESPERLLEAWTLAKPLCALHHAVSYRHIVATLEEHTKLEPFSAGYYWLRSILESALVSC